MHLGPIIPCDWPLDVQINLEQFPVEDREAVSELITLLIKKEMSFLAFISQDEYPYPYEECERWVVDLVMTHLGVRKTSSHGYYYM